MQPVPDARHAAIVPIAGAEMEHSCECLAWGIGDTLLTHVHTHCIDAHSKLHFDTDVFLLKPYIHFWFQYELHQI